VEITANVITRQFQTQVFVTAQKQSIVLFDEKRSFRGIYLRKSAGQITIVASLTQKCVQYKIKNCPGSSLKTAKR
jgi:hypothetical protein